MEKEIREQILKLAKEKGISIEEEIEIIRKGFTEIKKEDACTNYCDNKDDLDFSLE